MQKVLFSGDEPAMPDADMNLVGGPSFIRASDSQAQPVHAPEHWVPEFVAKNSSCDICLGGSNVHIKNLTCLRYTIVL